MRCRCGLSLGVGGRAFAGLVVVLDHAGARGFRVVAGTRHVMLMDFDPGITGIASQPFWLHWRAPTTELVYRHQLVPALTRGAEVMDQIFS